jgi:hypothetical protein
MFADYMLATVTDDPEEAAALSRQVYAMSVARRGFDKDNFEQTIGALELMRKIHRRQRCEADDCPDPVSEAELEVVLAEAGAQEAKALAKATRRLVARKGEDATVVLGDGVAIEVDGEHTKITVDTSKVRWPIPGCKPGSKCTFDTAARAVPPPPKPPAAPKIPPPAISP